MTKKYLHSLFNYRDGKLYWKTRKGLNVVIGSEAGRLHPDGYRYVMVDNKHHGIHRLIWIMFNDYIPAGIDIDHRDRDKANNKIENLRLATDSQNLHNAKTYKSNTSGYKGVSQRSDSGKWRARITVNNKRILLGEYDTAELASSAYKKVSKQLMGEYSIYQ